jgi:hypothetical protein
MFKSELLTQILMRVPEEHDVYIYFENSKCLVGFLKLIIFKKYLKLISEVLTLNQRLEIRHLIISFFICEMISQITQALFLSFGVTI